MNRCENTFPLQFGMVLICVGVTTPQLPPAPSSTANHTNRAERCTSAPALEPARFYVCKIGRDRIWTSSGIFSRNSAWSRQGFIGHVSGSIFSYIQQNPGSETLLTSQPLYTIGYVPPGIKESTCDDATIMSLMVL